MRYRGEQPNAEAIEDAKRLQCEIESIVARIEALDASRLYSTPEIIQMIQPEKEAAEKRLGLSPGERRITYQPTEM